MAADVSNIEPKPWWVRKQRRTPTTDLMNMPLVFGHAAACKKVKVAELDLLPKCSELKGPFEPTVLWESKTKRSQIWCIPRFETSLIISDFDQLELVKRPIFDLKGDPAVSHRDIGFFDLGALESLCLDPNIDLGINGWLGNSHAKNQHYADVANKQALHVNDSHRLLLAIGQKTAKFTKFTLDGLLVNLYRDGKDWIGRHADKEVPPGDMVMSLSFGATRTFRISDIGTGKHLMDIPHRNGMLLCMAGDCQQEIKHEIPPQKKILLPRLSITMRRHNKEA